MATLVLDTGPAEEPLELEEVKHHLRIDETDDDTLIESLITVARLNAESITRRALITQTWKYYLQDWPDVEYIELPYPPLQSVSSVKYTDYAGTVTTLTENTDYVVDIKQEPGRVVLDYGKEWPTATLDVTSPIEIIYICGYGTPEDIDEPLKIGMKIDVSDMYEHRESYVTQPYQHLPILDRLYWPYRVELIR